jgi:hypothetical protein
LGLSLNRMIHVLATFKSVNVAKTDTEERPLKQASDNQSTTTIQM